MSPRLTATPGCPPRYHGTTDLDTGSQSRNNKTQQQKAAEIQRRHQRPTAQVDRGWRHARENAKFGELKPQSRAVHSFLHLHFRTRAVTAALAVMMRRLEGVMTEMQRQGVPFAADKLIVVVSIVGDICNDSGYRFNGRGSRTTLTTRRVRVTALGGWCQHDAASWRRTRRHSPTPTRVSHQPKEVFEAHVARITAQLLQSVQFDRPGHKGASNKVFCERVLRGCVFQRQRG